MDINFELKLLGSTHKQQMRDEIIKQITAEFERLKAVNDRYKTALTFIGIADDFCKNECEHCDDYTGCPCCDCSTIKAQEALGSDNEKETQKTSPPAQDGRS